MQKVSSSLYTTDCNQVADTKRAGRRHPPWSYIGILESGKQGNMLMKLQQQMAEDVKVSVQTSTKLRTLEINWHLS